MRPLVLVPLLALLLGASACTTTPADGSGRIQTTEEAKRENMEGAVSAPLRDLNVLRTMIPDVLLEAMADPYARPPRLPRSTRSAQCSQLAALIGPLDEALGADLDEPPVEGGLDERGTTLGLVAAATSDVIPFRGWVRKLSGAERHDKLVQQAILAGAIRRAYLKGLGESRGCDPPATPSHVRAGTPPVVEKRMPRFPIRLPAGEPRPAPPPP
jgi:hypothetical protein